MKELPVALITAWTDLEPFQLLRNKDDFQPDAVEAAMAEMSSRKQSETESEALLKACEEQQF